MVDKWEAPAASSGARGVPASWLRRTGVRQRLQPFLVDETSAAIRHADLQPTLVLAENTHRGAALERADACEFVARSPAVAHRRGCPVEPPRTGRLGARGRFG